MTPAELILQIEDRPRVEVQAWGQTLYMQPMSGTDRDSYDMELHRAKDEKRELENWRARYVVRCLFDAQGQRVFTNEQAEALGKKNSETIRRLFDLASDASKTGGNALEQEAKNS